MVRYKPKEQSQPAIASADERIYRIQAVFEGTQPEKCEFEVPFFGTFPENRWLAFLTDFVVLMFSRTPWS
jgi:hypothetical protein